MGRQHRFDWEALANQWRVCHRQVLWRRYSDLLNKTLIKRWVVPVAGGLALKTDLFDEAFGIGIYPELGNRLYTVVGVDLSSTVALQARSRHPSLAVLGADLRCLPFDDQTFDLVVSNSSLDHFETRAELDQGLAELHRVLRPGGELVLTLDNPTNPLIGLRNLLPYSWLQRVGLVPYYMGVTYSASRLGEKLSALGLEVVQTTAILHFPRVLAVPLTRVAEHLGLRAQRVLLTTFGWFERLERFPTRAITGHFVAVRALRPMMSDL